MLAPPIRKALPGLTAKTAPAAMRPRRPPVPEIYATLQRKCACGAPTPVAGTCVQCAGNERALQRKLAGAPPAEPGDRQAGRSGGPAAARNRTGMPDHLKAGLEGLSGLNLSAVRVHRDSSQPARISAHAYTTGTDIFLAPGQERHLPHEGWHVVQQMQSRVAPTFQSGGMAFNDDRGLEREADSLGSKADALGRRSKAGAFATKQVVPGVAEDDELHAARQGPSAPQPANGSTKRSSVGQAKNVIQRVATFTAGPVTATRNVAAMVASDEAIGYTPPTLNGATILRASEAQAAIRPPVLARRTNPDRTVAKRVAAVGTNVGSYTMDLPTAGPWSARTTMAEVVDLYAMPEFASRGVFAPPACAAGGASTLTVNGMPTNPAYVANVRAHENLHVADHRLVFTAEIGSWDLNLEEHRVRGTWFNGANDAAAEVALFAEMDGTPAEIATQLNDDWALRAWVMHRRGRTSATGGHATPVNIRTNAACTASSLDIT